MSLRFFLPIAGVLLLHTSARAQHSIPNDSVHRVPHSELRQIHRADLDPYAYAYASVDSEPQPIGDVRKEIVYPPAAIRNHWEGRVYLRFLVLEDGTVGRVLIEKSSRKVFNDAAIRAIKRVTMKPAMKDGKPVRVWTSQVIDFRLK